MVSECETVEKTNFEDWMTQVGWPWEAIYKVDLIHQAGQIWNV